MEELQEQVYRLEAQIKEISQSPHKVAVSVETTPKTTPTKDQGGSPVSLFIYLLLFIYLFIIIIIIYQGSSSTTMIFSGMSEKLLLLILQKLDELSREILTGRTEDTIANRYSTCTCILYIYL